MKQILINASVWVVAVLLWGACQRNVVEDEIDEADAASEYFENEDDYEWDSTQATKIYLLEDDVDIEGDGAVFEDSEVKIQDAGAYWVTGTLNDGKIRVQASDDDKVQIILDDVSLSCSNDAAMIVDSSDRTVIILKAGTENSFSDGNTRASDNVNAALYSKSDLAFSGTGSLEVTANYEDGITSKDGLIICSGTYIVNAQDDGIRGKDYFLIKDGSYTITSLGDALKSDNEEDGCGYITIQTGTFIIDAGGDGFAAYSDLTISDGDFTVECQGYQSSSKGLKAGSTIEIDGGSYIVDATDDAIHSDEDITITGGTYTLASGDDGVHAESTLQIDYAEMSITESYEGLEAKTINILDGEISIVASDDGINATSGSNSGSANVYIAGGIIAVYAEGDGLDANGSFEIEDGLILVHGPTSSSNGALDYDGSFAMNGGILVAAGSSGMAEQPSSSSSQNSVLIKFSSTYEANTLLHLQDSDGDEIVTFEPDHNYQSVVISHPDLEEGSSYSLYTGGSHSGTDIYGYYQNGEYTAGTLYTTFSVTATTTTVSSSGTGGGGSTTPGGGGGRF